MEAVNSAGEGLETCVDQEGSRRNSLGPTVPNSMEQQSER